MEKVSIRHAPWSQEAAAMLAAAEQAASLHDLQTQVEQGGASLFEVIAEDGALLACYVLRVDPGISGDEGVILSAAGRADFDLVANVLPVVEGQFHGVTAIRMHTARPGLIRKVAKQGYKPVEFVLKKAVVHGQQ